MGRRTMIGAALLLMACGSSDTTGPPAEDVLGGTWTASDLFPLTLDLAQRNGAISGTANLTSSSGTHALAVTGTYTHRPLTVDTITLELHGPLVQMRFDIAGQSAFTFQGEITRCCTYDRNYNPTGRLRMTGRLDGTGLDNRPIIFLKS